MKIPARSELASTLLLVVLTLSLTSLAKTCKGKMENKQSSQWFSNAEWTNDLDLNPHRSTNQAAFEKEYKANQVLWDKAFEWMRETDLQSIAPGTYILVEDKLKAIVSEEPAPEKDDVKWEAHKNFNDIQYIVKGKALMGVAPVSEAGITEAYDSSKDVGFYAVEGKYHTADPGSFFIFTPEEAHRPGIKVEGYDVVKKVVIKVRAKSQDR